MVVLSSDNIQFIHEFTCLLIQIKTINISFICMLSFFECISLISCNFKL